MKTDGKTIIGTLLLTGGWASMLVSVAVYMFYWRVHNEPGAGDAYGILAVSISFCSLGGLTFVGSHIYLLMKRAWLMLGIGWVLCGALLVGAVTIVPILLLFMV